MARGIRGSGPNTAKTIEKDSIVENTGEKQDVSAQVTQVLEGTAAQDKERVAELLVKLDEVTRDRGEAYEALTACRESSNELFTEVESLTQKLTEAQDAPVASTVDPDESLEPGIREVVMYLREYAARGGVQALYRAESGLRSLTLAVKRRTS